MELPRTPSTISTTSDIDDQSLITPMLLLLSLISLPSYMMHIYRHIYLLSSSLTTFEKIWDATSGFMSTPAALSWAMSWGLVTGSHWVEEDEDVG